MNSSGILTINLAAIQDNWQVIRSQAALTTESGAVIKANAYGLGALRVAAALYDVGCRTFFLATLEEALAVKSLCLSDSNLVVLGGARPGNENDFIERQLIPVLYSKDAVERWMESCNRRSIAAPCILKVDTGMTRLGLDDDDLLFLEQNFFRQPFFKPVIVMSHLACADEYSHSQNEQQLQNFKNVVERVQYFFPQMRFSLANSSGVFLGASWHFDLLRPGSALYGINPTPHLANPMKPVVKLTLPILQVKDLAADAQVGYGASHSAIKGARLAVVAGGYADGVHRSLGMKPLAKLMGIQIEAVGRVSMDTTIFDISAIEDPASTLTGKLITVMDDEFTLDFLTRRNSSLGYEVLTSLGMRYQRVYME